MSIDAYCEAMRRACNELSVLPIVVVCNVTFDMRPPEQAYITGVLEWNDGSELHWKEYIDNTSGTIEKLRYSYHYQDLAKNLIFRYDNALHKPRLPYKEHKHIASISSIIAASAPDLMQVADECLAMLKW